MNEGQDERDYYTNNRNSGVKWEQELYIIKYDRNYFKFKLTRENQVMGKNAHTLLNDI